jgi:hypothetical protein
MLCKNEVLAAVVGLNIIYLNSVSCCSVSQRKNTRSRGLSISGRILLKGILQKYRCYSFCSLPVLYYIVSVRRQYDVREEKFL